MVFTSPTWVPSLDLDGIPDSISVSQFMLEERYGRAKLRDCSATFTCGLSGAQFTASEVKQRVDFLARGLAEDLGWSPNKGSEWDKLVTIFAHNTVDNIPLSWAIHNVNGISSPANPTYTASELSHQIKSSGSQAIFTSNSLLHIALKAATECSIPRKHVYIIAMANERSLGYMYPPDLKTVDQLIVEGSQLPRLEPLRWEKGQGARQCAFLTFSSGTTGLPKGVIISHKNVIANILQQTTFEASDRRPGEHKVVLGLLPQSHIYALVAICHTSIYRGDSVIVLPKFELSVLAAAIARFKINILYVVPPIVIQMINSNDRLQRFNLSSVTDLVCAAAPLGIETYRALSEQYPSWYVRQGYGMTETAVTVSMTSPRDILPGSVGTLLPGVEARLISLSDGSEITECDKSGELLLRSPSVARLGYLNNEKATTETFKAGDGTWLRTGDEAMFRQNPQRDGHEHLFIIDRIKELIKVNGHQVSPAELEACLLDHPLVADAAVIPVSDAVAGELPKAFIMLAPHDRGQFFQSHAELADELDEFVRKEKSHYKWLRGGIEFVDSIPKSPSGKILRRVLRDAERLKGRREAARL